MKVLHTISGMGVKCGGTSTCTYELVKGLIEQKVDAGILSFMPAANDRLIGNDIPIHTIPIPNNTRVLYSKAYKKFLIDTQYQVFHTNGLWQYPEYITSKVARKRDIPYLISPHGMLYPQAIRKSAFLKKTVFGMFLKNDLNKATAVHATCMEEMNYLRCLGVKSPIAVIPNPVQIEQEDMQITLPKDKLRVGYLGRIHPRKNIEKLFYAWDKLGKIVDDCELVIIGDGNENYLHFLKQEVQRLNLNNVVFTGFLSGEEKDSALKSLSYLVVPSDYENFGMIVPEALVKGIPVIASKGTPWEELNIHCCGWWIENDIDTLATNIETAISTTENMRQEMGQNGKRLVMEIYSIEVVAKKMKMLYEWILIGGDSPKFVYYI